MTESTFEKLTRSMFISAALLFAVCFGWTLKEGMLHRIQQQERKQLSREYPSRWEFRLIEFATEPTLDEGEDTMPYAEEPPSDAL